MLPEAVPVLGFVTLQRLGELWLSARNEKRLRALEIALLPLAFGLVGYAVAFTAANAALLAWRMHVEDSGLRAGPAMPRSRPHSPVSGRKGPR